MEQKPRPTPTPQKLSTTTLAESQRKRPRLRAASEIEEEELQWLWYPYIPAGKLTLLEGDPGLGKSWITCKLAADISAGRKLPGMEQALPPQTVIMLSAEDGLGDTVRPRLNRLGADLDRVLVSDDYFILDKAGLADVRDMIQQSAATIVFLDPLVAYLGGKIDMNKANEARAMMGPLADIAKETGTPIIAVRHLRKGGSTNAKYSGIGSIDFTAAARSVLQVQESEGGDVYMAHVKHNLSPKGDSLGYEVKDGSFNWTGRVDFAQGPRKTMKAATQEADRFIFDALRDGPREANEVQKEAEAQGISRITLQRAKKGVVESYKQGAIWMWALAERGGIPYGTQQKLDTRALFDALAQTGQKG